MPLLVDKYPGAAGGGGPAIAQRLQSADKHLGLNLKGDPVTSIGPFSAFWISGRDASKSGLQGEKHEAGWRSILMQAAEPIAVADFTAEQSIDRANLSGPSVAQALTDALERAESLPVKDRDVFVRVLSVPDVELLGALLWDPVEPLFVPSLLGQGRHFELRPMSSAAFGEAVTKLLSRPGGQSLTLEARSGMPGSRSGPQ